MTVKYRKEMTVAGSAVNTASPWHIVDPCGDVRVSVYRPASTSLYNIEYTLDNPLIEASCRSFTHPTANSTVMCSAAGGLMHTIDFLSPIHAFRFRALGVAGSAATTFLYSALQG